MEKNSNLVYINKAIDYINTRIKSPLTAAQVADFCGFSRFYFSRLFKLVTGHGVYDFIKTAKLERAAFNLVYDKAKSITEIAAEIRYSSSNFSTLFSDRYGISPREFRNENRIDLLKNGSGSSAILRDGNVETEKRFRELDAAVTLRTVPAMTLEYERYTGGYSNLEPRWQQFQKRVFSKNPDYRGRFIGISYDDEKISKKENSLYDFCLEVHKTSSLQVHHFPEQLCGIFKHRGPAAEVSRNFDDLLLIWLAFSKHRIGPGLFREVYLSPPDRSGNIDYEIWIPLQN